MQHCGRCTSNSSKNCNDGGMNTQIAATGAHHKAYLRFGGFAATATATRVATAQQGCDLLQSFCS